MKHRFTILSINISSETGVQKKPVPKAVIRKHYGIVGDAHAGTWHRQISLLASEDIDRMRGKGIEINHGDFAENITTQGINLSSLPVGTRLNLGDAMYTISALVTHGGGIPVPMGIIPDRFDALLETAQKALSGANILVITAGSSVSTRDLTAQVINQLGSPGVLIHGVSIKPGKPTILAVCDTKPVFGLPGNPVSAMIVSELFLLPIIQTMQGASTNSLTRGLIAVLTGNIPSAAGREDHVPVKIVDRSGRLWADPVFGKSNLIHTLIQADGIVTVPIDSNGLAAGEQVHVRLNV